MPKDLLTDATGGTQWPRRAVLLAGGLLMAGCGGPKKPVIQSEDYDGDSNKGRLRAILERRTKALADRNEEAYLADLDQSNRELIDQEKLVFANLGRFEFAELRYVLGKWTERPNDLGAPTASRGAPSGTN